MELFGEIYREYFEFIYRVCLKYSKNEMDAEDWAMESIAKIVKSYDRFMLKSKLSTWIYRITSNYCIDQLRKKRFQNYSEEEQFDSILKNNHDVEYNYARKMDCQRMIYASNKSLKNMLQMVYSGGLNKSEIADGLGVSRQAINKRFKKYAELIPA